MLLVLQGTSDVVFGTLSMIKDEPRKRIAIVGVLLNGAYALFMAFVLSFVG